MDRLRDRTVYLDANAFIYGAEGVQPYFDHVAPMIRAVVAGTQRAVPSEVTLAECLVGPIKRQDPDGERAFYDLLRTHGGLVVAPVTRAVLIEAARLRAATRLKLSDAIHAASARPLGCGVLLTNDAGIGAVPGVEVLRQKSARSSASKPVSVGQHRVDEPWPR